MTRKFLPWMLALGLCAGNACAQLQATPVTVSNVAYELEGYSILPPQGKDWFELKRALRGDGRHRVIENRVEMDNAPGRFCVKYHTKAEDRGAPYAGGTALLAETFGVTCLHPENPQLNISVSYTERGNPSETSAEFRAEGERFVRSLKFTSHRP
ncbi:MAG: hypothetical protein HYS65_05870 [Betaproteobacteria bacterium]|nr:hypothetical protein [Betaproteobacteria bacterium]